MKEHLVVIENYGFLTVKKPNEVLETDEVTHKGSALECNNIIHGIQPKKL